MNEDVMISVAMATFNGEKYLREQIDSILAQTHQNFELVICDDCSTDGTVGILYEYETQDPRIHVYVNESNLGFKKNFERAISLCKGEYIALSDQDDVWLPEHLETLYKNLGDNPLVIGRAVAVDKDLNSLGFCTRSDDFYLSESSDGQFLQILYSNFVQGCVCLFSKATCGFIFPVPEEQKFHDYWIGLSVLASEYKISYTPAVISYYRLHDNNVDGRRQSIPQILKDRKRYYSSKLSWNKALDRIPLSVAKKKILDEMNDYFRANLRFGCRLKFGKWFVSNYRLIYSRNSNKHIIKRFIIRIVIGF